MIATKDIIDMMIEDEERANMNMEAYEEMVAECDLIDSGLRSIDGIGVDVEIVDGVIKVTSLGVEHKDAAGNVIYTSGVYTFMFDEVLK